MVYLQSFNPFAPRVVATSEVSELRVYPIKSCRGISMTSGYLTRQGLDLDRNWMFTAPRDDQQFSFMTIRDVSELTLIDTDFTSPSGRAPDAFHDDLQLVISVRNQPGKKVTIPARPSHDWLTKNTTYEKVQIWNNITDGWVYGEHINSVFRDGLGRDVKLVYKGPQLRKLKGNASLDELGREEWTNFPDVMPVLLANEASLHELNGRLRSRGAKDITIERFRPNIIVRGGDKDGMPAWSEDDWKLVRIVADADSRERPFISVAPPSLEIDVQAHCARCQVPNVNPETAEKDPHEPWDTLVSYRRIDTGIKWKPCFGMLSCPRSDGPIKVGMKLEVLGLTKSHVYQIGF